MSEWVGFVLGFFFGLLTALVLARRHIQRICAQLDDFLEDEVIAPLRKTDAPRAYRLQSIYRILFQRLERLI